MPPYTGGSTTTSVVSRSGGGSHVRPPGPDRRETGHRLAESLAAHGNWRPAAWRIDFAVRRRGELVGLQELEANDFTLLRTVDSASWLVPAHRAQGVGVAMRTAVLALAFGPLEAKAAITSAWPDNHGSLGVSRSLGYRPNGEHLHARGERHRHDGPLAPDP